jgi:hypothetical protein
MVADKETPASSPLTQHQQQVAGLLGDPAALGVGGHPARCTRRVSSSMRNSTYSRRSNTVSTVKQVAGDDPGGLLASECPPGAVGSPWCRVEPAAAQGGADRGRRDMYAKVEQFALDGLVAPPGVLLGEADDQLWDVAVQRWPPVWRCG